MIQPSHTKLFSYIRSNYPEVHNIQADVPPEKVLAIYETAKEWRECHNKSCEQKSYIYPLIEELLQSKSFIVRK
jgi:hypothetical protein